MLRNIGRAVAVLGDPKALFVAIKVAVVVALALASLGVGLYLLAERAAGYEFSVFGWRIAPFEGFLENLAIFVGVILAAVMALPLTAAVASLFADEIVEVTERRYFPDLPAVRSTGFVRSVRAAIRMFGWIVAANLLLLPVYFLAAALAPFVALAVNGYLIAREYHDMAAMRRLPEPEVAASWRRVRWRTWLGGILTAIAMAIPIVNLAAPFFGVALATLTFHEAEANSELTAVAKR